MTEMASSSMQRNESLALSQQTAHGRNFRTDFVFLGALYMGELSALAALLSLYVFGRKPSLQEYLHSRPGYVLAGALIGLIVSVIIIAHRYGQSKLTGSKTFLMTVTMNLVTVIMVLTLGETTIRTFYKETPTGDVLGDTYLLPREWDKVVAYNHEFFRNTLDEGLYHKYDELLGWTIAPNRQNSEYGLYFSSAEGLRSPSPGIKFADQPASTRIAVIGDSYAFAEEVSFEESWGHQLERQLGKDFQVLNFGVMGYGIDQAYLRYMKEVRPWHPDMVIFGFIDHNLDRAMGIYSFLTFPTSFSPYAKPRFVMKDQQLVLLNTPLPMPAQIFSARSIHDLPYIEYDRGYLRGEWDRRFWIVPVKSYLFRWLTTRLPLSEATRPEVSDDVMRTISGEIFRAFVKQVTDDGAIPLLMYFPNEPSLPGSSQYLPGYHPLSAQVLEEARLPYLDLTSCLANVPAGERFAPLRHYTPEATPRLHGVLCNQLRTTGRSVTIPEGAAFLAD